MMYFIHPLVSLTTLLTADVNTVFPLEIIRKIGTTLHHKLLKNGPRARCYSQILLTVDQE
jgi:hypothetical protein